MSTYEELLARKEHREKARRAEEEASEAEALTLEEKYEEGGKRHGIDFAVVRTAVGNFVVAKPDFITAKRFNAIEKKAEEDIVKFVLPSVLFPPRDQIGSVFQEHGGIAWKLTLAMLQMYSGDFEVSVKK